MPESRLERTRSAYVSYDHDFDVQPVILRQRVLGAPSWRIEFEDGVPRLVRIQTSDEQWNIREGGMHS